ncbi:MAG: M56 family metallopeptidase [Planctomycetaceae bacterium]
MNASDLIDASFSYRLIASLLNFLWQGCLVALATVPVDLLLKNAPAGRRYALHVTALTTMVVCVTTTFLWIEPPVSLSTVSAEYPAARLVTNVSPLDHDRSPLPSFADIHVSSSDFPAVAASIESDVPQDSRERRGDAWNDLPRWAPHIALFYLICSASLLARLVHGTWAAHQLRKLSTIVCEESLIAVLHSQSKSLGLRIMPRIAWCTEVSVPVVIGIFKPMILLPTAAVTGLSPDQLQALITHELAHIYRHDLLVNLLQRIVESLLFFHPAVWYISRRISSEREHACDEIVLATGCERLRYADALVRMAELSTTLRHPGRPAAATSLAAIGRNSSEFKRRVLKVLAVPQSSQLRPSRVALLSMLTIVLCLAVVGARLNLNALADTPPDKTETESTPPAGLEFLKPYPKLHGLSLDMTDSQFLKIVKQHDLKSRTTVEAGKVTHHVALGDDHTLVVMFDQNGKCSGIQRVRGESEDTNDPANVSALPQGKESQSLFRKWQRTARTNGDIPGGTIRPLVRVMTNFVKNNPTHEGSPKFAELLKRIDVSRDWSRNEAVKLLDEVTGIYPSLPEWVEDEPRFTLGGDVVSGKALPDDLKEAPWGEAQPNGLRTAWLLEPRGTEHRLNTGLKSRVLFHNSGRNPVLFQALTWNQSGEHKAHDSQGNSININSTYWTTIPRSFVCHLAPGEFIEVIGAGIAVGPNKDDEDWRDARSEVRVGSWIEAKAGDEVTFTPDAVHCVGRDSARQDDDVSPSTPNFWWLKFIKDRLSFHAPLPADVNERGKLLEQVVRDLFGNAPTNEELMTFKNDTSPVAIDSLAKRLSERAGFEAFSGSLNSGPTKFKVLPVDPDAAKKPRIAKSPGQFPLGSQVTFVVSRRPIGERIVNEAHLRFAPTDATKPAPHDPHPIPLPDDYDSWIAGWMRGGTVLWIAQSDANQKTSVRRYDFTNPSNVVESVITELKVSETLPDAILDVVSKHFQRIRGTGSSDEIRAMKPQRYFATLPSGVEVELAGVSLANDSFADQSKRKEERNWWRADGRWLQALPITPFSFSLDNSQRDFREFVFKLTPARNEDSLTASFVRWSPQPRSGSSGLAGWNTSGGKPGFLLVQRSASFNEEKVVAVHVLVSDQQYGPAWLIDGNGQTLPQKPADARTQALRKLIKIVGVEKSGNETIFRTERLPIEIDSLLDFNLKAIDHKNQSHASTGARGSNAGDGRVFKLAFADIKHFEIRLRPMTSEVTFENVSLVPGQFTDVNVRVKSVDPLAPPQAAAGKADLVDLKKMVEDLAILIPEHWRPRLAGGRTIEMRPGSYLNSEESPRVVLVFTSEKTRPETKWETKTDQYEYLGETLYGHAHLFVSMNTKGLANAATMRLIEWPDTTEFFKAFLKGDHTSIAAIRKRAERPRPAARNFIRNGLKFELESVSFVRTDSSRAANRTGSDLWSADGTRLDSNAANPEANAPLKDQAHFREFVLRARVVDGQEIIRHTAGEFWVPPSPSQQLLTSRLAGTDILRFQLIKTIDVEKPATFALYFTDEPWSLAASLDLNGKMHPETELDATYKSLVQQFEVSVVEKLAATTIVKVHPTSDAARRTHLALSAIKIDGQVVRAIEPTSDQLYIVNAPASEIDAFQVSLRRMTHKATFESVATMPGQMTEPKVSLEPLNTLVRVTIRKDGKALGILSDMSITQLQEMLPVMLHDLNSVTSELIIETQIATTFQEANQVVERLKASGWKWPSITVKPPDASIGTDAIAP